MAVEYTGDVGSGTNRGFASLTFSVTVSDNDDRLMVIAIAAYNPGGSAISSVTYDGVAATFITNQSTPSHGFVALYYLVAPTVGTADVVVTFGSATNALVCGAGVFRNVDQTTPISNAVEDRDSTIDVSSATGNMVVDIFGVWPTGTYTEGTGQTPIFQLDDGHDGIDGNMSYEAGSSTVTMDWTPGGTDPAIAAVNLNAVPGEPSSRILKPNTLRPAIFKPGIAR